MWGVNPHPRISIIWEVSSIRRALGWSPGRIGAVPILPTLLWGYSSNWESVCFAHRRLRVRSSLAPQHRDMVAEWRLHWAVNPDIRNIGGSSPSIPTYFQKPYDSPPKRLDESGRIQYMVSRNMCRMSAEGGWSAKSVRLVQLQLGT